MVVRLALFLAHILLLVNPTTAENTAWEFRTFTDPMSGETRNYIISYSKNRLHGWLRSGRLVLGYSCNSSRRTGLYVRANDMGFSPSRGYHHSRVKFDKDPPSNIKFRVSSKNNDVMRLSEWTHFGPEGDDEEFLIANMKSSRDMFLEVELFGTKGAKQVAQFDLTGFSASFERCVS